MNAQSNHPINDTTDPLFLGPEAGQQAGGEGQGLQELMAWNEDGVCATPTDHRVEPDGTGPDGVPSWLRALRLI